MTQSWFNYRSTPRRAGFWRQALGRRRGRGLRLRPRGRRPPALGPGHRRLARDLVAAAPRRTTSSGRWGTNWDQIVPGDWDGDRRQDDLLQWDVHSGAWLVTSWSAAGPQMPRQWQLADRLRHDPGRRLRRGQPPRRDVPPRPRERIGSGSSRGARSSPRSSGSTRGPTAYNQFVVGDFDSDGELNDMLIRQSASGAWQMTSWDGFRPRWRRSGTWLPRYKRIVAADLDAEGRVDDIVLHSPRTGQRLVIEWHYYRWRRQGRTTTARAWDQIIAAQRG